MYSALLSKEGIPVSCVHAERMGRAFFIHEICLNEVYIARVVRHTTHTSESVHNNFFRQNLSTTEVSFGFKRSGREFEVANE